MTLCRSTAHRFTAQWLVDLIYIYQEENEQNSPKKLSLELGYRTYTKLDSRLYITFPLEDFYMKYV